MDAPGHALARHARERPDALALIDDRLRLTWAEVEDWVDSAAGWLDAQGFSRGAPVLWDGRSILLQRDHPKDRVE